MSLQRLAMTTLVVRDYDEAITWFTRVLRWQLVEDQPVTETKRWVVVAPQGGGSALLLARAASAEQGQPSVTRPAAASRCSCTRTTSTPTSRICGRRASSSPSLHRASSPTDASSCSATSTATSGT
jgi:hypothetical protein